MSVGTFVRNKLRINKVDQQATEKSCQGRPTPIYSLPAIDELAQTLRRYGIRASDLGRKAGVDKTIVSKILNHKYNPSYEMMVRLFGVLDQLIKEDSKRVSDVMVREVVTSDMEDSLPSVISKMRKGGFSQIPVLAKGRFVGMVTERSLMLRGEGASRVGDVLGSDFAVVEPDTPLENARQTLLTCQALVVVQKGTVVGILTKTDFIASSPRGLRAQ